MKRIGQGISARLKIVAATATVIFTLLTVFTSTIAWFSTKTSATVGGGSFTVKPVSGMQYDLYYLDHFDLNPGEKDGNFNSEYDIFSGYEVAAGTPVFEPIRFNDSGEVIDENDQVIDNPNLNPTNISNLWPAHKLTYAIVIEGESRFNSFSLDSWVEQTNPNVITKDAQDQDVLISLTWAINMSGIAYKVDETNEVTDDIATAFAYYKVASLSDRFGYRQTYNDPSDEPVLPLGIADSIVDQSSGSDFRQILFFSIEFDDSEDTYYKLSYDEENDPNHLSPYYVKNIQGNSNCYKGLSLSDLVFKLS